jgi:hypothetical protein
MNRKQLYLLIVAGVLIAGLGLWISQRRSSGWQSTNQGATPKLLGDFPVNEVAQILIRHTTNELTLAKGESVWQVKERSLYPANFVQISELVRKLADLKPVQGVKVGASKLGYLELTPPDKGTNSGTLVELKDKTGKTLKSLLLGKKHMRNSGEESPFGGGGGWPDGRYVTVPGTTPQAVWLVSDAFSNVEPKPESWLDKEFIKVEKIKTISVTPTNAALAWKFSRETENGDLKLADVKPGEEPDANKIVGLVNMLSYANFNDVLPHDAKPEITGLDQPVIAKIETFDQFVYDIKIGKAGADDAYHMTVSVSANLPTARTPGKDEKPEDKDKLDKEFKDKLEKQKTKLAQEKACDPWIYLVSSYTVENLLKPRTHWMVEKKEEKKAETDKAADADSAPPLPPGITDPDKDMDSEGDEK